MLPFAELLAFVKVADCGSFTRAAIELDIAHSGLSRQVLQLEKGLGYRVFTRTGRGVKLTDAGRLLYERAVHLINLADRLEDDARALRGVVAGSVGIGMPGSIAQLIASPLVVSLSREHPQVSTRLVEGLSGAIEEQLATGRLDIGMYFTYRDRPVAGETMLFLSDLYLVGPGGDRFTRQGTVPLARLDRLPLVLPAEPHSIRRMVDQSLNAIGVRAAVAHEVESMSTMKRLVEDGVGYTVTTWSSVAREVRERRLTAAKVVDPVLTRGLVLSGTRHHPCTAAARAVMAQVTSLVARIVRQPKWRLRPPQATR